MRSLFKQKYVIPGVIAASLLLIGFCLYLCCAKQPEAVSNAINTTQITLSGNHRIQITRPENPEKGLLIYISDKHSPHKDYSNQFAQLSYTVASIDSRMLLALAKNPQKKCAQLADTLKNITNQLNTTYDLDSDNLPILVGEGEGAALVYTALAQADKNTFHAGVSLDFNAQLSTNDALCPGDNFTSELVNQHTRLNPSKHLPTSWYLFQNPELAKSTNTQAFTNKVSNARLTLSEAGKQPVNEAIQILQWLDPRLSDQISSDTGDGDLPLIEVVKDSEEASSEQQTPQTQSPYFAIILTGDGGWAEIDKNIANILAKRGIPTVALDSLSYFWKERTPIDTATDVQNIISQYSEKWGKHQVILIGYSFGADVLPFIANNLNEESRNKVALVALLGMGKTAAFEFRLSSWMNADKNPTRMPIPPELEKMRWATSVCIYGVDDPDSNCKQIANTGVKIISMSGDHHFDKKYDELVENIVSNAKPAP